MHTHNQTLQWPIFSALHRLAVNEVHKEMQSAVDLTRQQLLCMFNNVERWSYLFDLCLFDFFQGNSDLLCLQFGSLLLLDGHTGTWLIQLSSHNHKTQTETKNVFWFHSLASSMSFIIPLAGIRHHATTTSLNSHQPSKPFKYTSLGHDGAWCHVRNLFFSLCFRLLTCPLQQDAITSILQVVNECVFSRV